MKTLIIVFLILLSSCSSVKKASNKHAAKIDSISLSVERQAVSSVTDINSHAISFDTSVRTASFDFERVIEIEEFALDTGTQIYRGGAGTSIIRKTKVTERGKSLESEIAASTSEGSFHSNVVDSISNEGVYSVEVHKELSSREASIKKTKLFPGWILLLPIALVLYILYQLYKKANPFQ